MDSKRTLEKVLVDNTPILFGNDHAGPMDLLIRKLEMAQKMHFRDVF